MQQLRIVGVESQQRPPVLLLSDKDGVEYSVEISEALRAAVGGTGAHRAARVEEPGAFGPREIQARLRAGASVEEVVEASGHDREYVIRFAGPVADERAFHGARARAAVIARSSSSENHRLAFGDAPATLEAMVRVRLRAVGAPPGTASWDAWRREDGLWTVSCDFDLDPATAHSESVGEQPPALWSYDPTTRALHPQNKWAEALSSLPRDASRRQPGRRLAAVEEPFDVDSASAPASRRVPDAGAGHEMPAGADAEDLLDILRARRGQRLGTDEAADDKLATLITRDEEAPVAPRLQPVEPVEDEDPEEHVTETLPGLDEIQRRGGSEEAGAPEAETGSEAEPASGAQDVDAWGFSYADDQETTPLERPEADAGAEAGTEADDAPKRGRRKSRRPSMPSWDDILFGSKSD
ncbi:septation protein SepH [Nesterenkonia sp. NBAIMH1]|uniref:septation protein SepH n=1 Tax=Nesterenkonia sp. NBAIMH1 TaxID=2600320 RepID=UPI00143D1C4B|nr:septation protein SepH [Nesterenkonia sp. NBAIMH1]